ncbi:UNKNOWN [Stylonychia lemnae]|uniref:Uncharacterized protein n=1 Tax=Stylonychia lemnae TaxID=5949 RepID=A0A078B1E0_STYLE|nr:UNKNOWN [Stylonychia lemnae]|eukprot:CDW87013.1 UNKNOWN [Stylonychia lemnae]
MHCNYKKMVKEQYLEEGKKICLFWGYTQDDIDLIAIQIAPNQISKSYDKDFYIYGLVNYQDGYVNGIVKVNTLRIFEQKQSILVNKKGELIIFTQDQGGNSYILIFDAKLKNVILYIIGCTEQDQTYVGEEISLGLIILKFQSEVEIKTYYKYGAYNQTKFAKCVSLDNDNTNLFINYKIQQAQDLLGKQLIVVVPLETFYNDQVDQTSFTIILIRSSIGIQTINDWTFSKRANII